METVTVKAVNPQYDGFVRGFRFVNGVAHDVPVKEAETMVKEFGLIIEKPAPVVKAKRKAKGE